MTVENVIRDRSMLAVSGNVHLHESASTDDLPAAPPVSIIQTDQTLYVHFIWRQSGWLTNLFSHRCTWECQVYLEQMGAGEYGNPSPTRVPFSPGNRRNSAYVTISNIPEGAYKIVATLVLRGPGGGPSPVAAYEEVGILQVYND